MKLLIAAVLGFSFLTSAVGAPASAEDRKIIIENGRAGCMAKQNESPDHSERHARMANEYCTCIGEQFAEGVTAEQAALIRAGDFSPIAKRADKVYAACVAKVQKTTPGVRAAKP